jgi:diguanylate cyclase (GGDEF)-like protein
VNQVGAARSATELEQRADTARRSGDHAAAADGFALASEAATTLSERSRLRIRQANCLLNLGQTTEAEQIALDVLGHRDELDPVVVADSLVVVSVVRRLDGAVTASMEALADALTFMERGSRRHPDFSRVMHNVAVGHSRAGLWDRSLTLFERALEVTHPGGHELTLATMASTHIDLAVASDDEVGTPNEHIVSARILADRVLSHGGSDHIAAALASSNRAVCLLWDGDNEAAEAEARGVLMEAETQARDLEIVRATFVLAEVALRSKHRANALDRLRRCLEVAESRGIESFQPRLFRRLAAAHLASGDLDALYRTSLAMADWFERRIAAERADRVAHIELGVRHRLVEALSLEDPLTRLPNRRFLERWLPRALQSGHRLVVAVIDLDHFKQVNDTISYEAGDRVLGEFADLLRTAIRRGDVAARLGGDEFVLAVNAASLGAGQRALERLREEVEHHDWSGVAPGLTITISAGMVLADNADPASILRDASLALQQAKRSGRNRVTTVENPAPS